jgi:hypothetical protein
VPSECTIVRAMGGTANRLKAQEAGGLYKGFTGAVAHKALPPYLDGDGDWDD